VPRRLRTGTHEAVLPEITPAGRAGLNMCLTGAARFLPAASLRWFADEVGYLVSHPDVALPSPDRLIATVASERCQGHGTLSLSSLPRWVKNR
jgi:hypothetical protein